MSAVALTPLYSVMFLGELNRLSFTAAYMAEFAIRADGREIFRNSYFPDEDGIVTVHDLASLLEVYIPELCTDFSFYVDGSALGPAAIKVFYCAWSVDVPAHVFIPRNFLTPMQGVRNTHPDRYETLSLFSSSAEDAWADCVYFADGATVRTQVSLGSASGQRLLNVSSRRFLNAIAGQLVEYTVCCGPRRATFRVLDYVPELSEAFIFRNSFNAWDTLYLTGTREVDPQYTRASASVNGYMRNYDIREVVQLKSYTGPLPEGMEWLSMSLARSKAVFFLLETGDCGDEVFISDCDLKHNNNAAEAADLNFSYRNAVVSYRLADDRTARIRVRKAPRIFDDSFDQTYE